MTEDPTGAYYQHEFDFTGIGLPDYPKFGFATDAIAVTANLFVPFQGAAAGAIDKAEAFSDRQTTLVLFKLGAFEFGLLPGDNDGPAFGDFPPTFATNNGGGNSIDFWEIDPDYVASRSLHDRGGGPGSGPADRRRPLPRAPRSVHRPAGLRHGHLPRQHPVPGGHPRPPDAPAAAA